MIVHAVTRKGYGYQPAEDDEADWLHSPSAFDPQTGRPTAPASASPKWTSSSPTSWSRSPTSDPTLSASPPPWATPTGISKLAAKYPDRAFDVGIAEQHATTSAAGLALGGMHPVVAIYATFLNRAFDQVLLDVAMHRLPVTFVLDRAGITGPDGRATTASGTSPCSAWCRACASPRRATRATLRAELREAVAVEDGPTIVRFPTGAAPADLARDRADCRRCRRTQRTRAKDVLLVAVGSFAQPASTWPGGSPSTDMASRSSTRAGYARYRSS